MVNIQEDILHGEIDKWIVQDLYQMYGRNEVLETYRNKNIEDVRRKFYGLSEEVMGKLP